MRRPYGNSRFVPRMNEKTRFMLALIAPAALVLLCFQVVPILTGANASFRDWTLYDP
jgi:multiple sugar transport system permease protein